MDHTYYQSLTTNPLQVELVVYLQIEGVYVGRERDRGREREREAELGFSICVYGSCNIFF